MVDDPDLESARQAAKTRFDEASKAMTSGMDWARHDAEMDLIGRMMFGVSGKELTEDQDGSVIAFICKDRPVERLHRGAVRDAVVALGRLSVLYAAITERLEGRRQECEYLDLMVEAHSNGTVVGIAAVCDKLEVSWHDSRLSIKEGIEAVEAVEALRLALRRMEACGLAALSSFDASNPNSYPAMP